MLKDAWASYDALHDKKVSTVLPIDYPLRALFSPSGPDPQDELAEGDKSA